MINKMDNHPPVKSDERYKLVIRLLELLNSRNDKTDVIREILISIKNFIGVEAAGIRLKEGDNYPHYEAKGFSDDFIKSERNICSYNDVGEIIRDQNGNVILECMCGNVISGKTETMSGFFTEKGSFWTNNLAGLVSSGSKVELFGHLRNRCNSEGYKSMTLIPLRSDDEIVGLLQLNDKRKDVFSKEQVVFFEGVGESIGIALKRRLAEDELSRHRNTLEKMIKNRTAELAKTSGKLKVEIDEHHRDEITLKRVNRSLNALSESMKAIANEKDEPGLLKRICDIIVEAGGYRLAWIGFAEENSDKTVKPVAQVGYEDGYLESIKISYSDNEHGRGPTGTAIRTGDPSVCRNIIGDPEFEPWREQAVERGYSSSLAIPLKSDGYSIGALNIYSKDNDAFDSEEIILLSELADNLAYGIISLRTREESKSSEKERKKALKELELIFNTVSIGISFIDLDSNFIMANKQFFDMFSLNENEVIGNKCRNIFEHSRCDTSNCTMKRILAGEDNVEYELFKDISNGMEIICIVNSVPYISQDGEIVGIIQYYLDVTEKRKIQREYMNVIGEERQRIGNDLHDVIGQNLTAIAFLIEATKQKMNKKSYSEASGNIDQISNLINDATMQTRKITRMLCPVEIGKGGLSAAIEGIAESTREIYNVQCRVFKKGNFNIDDSQSATNIFFIAREAVNNAVKHGNVGNINIYLTSDDTGLNMVIQDDGQGLKGKEKDTGVGLKIMKYRAEMIGAGFSAENHKDGGFAVELSLKK